MPTLNSPKFYNQTANALNCIRIIETLPNGNGRIVTEIKYVETRVHENEVTKEEAIIYAEKITKALNKTKA